MVERIFSGGFCPLTAPFPFRRPHAPLDFLNLAHCSASLKSVFGPLTRSGPEVKVSQEHSYTAKVARRHIALEILAPSVRTIMEIIRVKFTVGLNTNVWPLQKSFQNFRSDAPKFLNCAIFRSDCLEMDFVNPCERKLDFPICTNCKKYSIGLQS